MSQRKGGGAPERDGRERPDKKRKTEVAPGHLSFGAAQAIAADGAMTPAQQAHVAGCRACRVLVARADDLVRWRKAVAEYPQAAPEMAPTPGLAEEGVPVLELTAYERYQANRKALDGMHPFHLRLDLAKGRVVRIDRRRPDGPYGKVESGVRLPLSASHAVDIITAGAPPGLEIVVAEIEADRPVRLLRGAQVGVRRGNRWLQTSSTDPTGRVRIEMPKRGKYVLEVVHTLAGDTLLGKVEIEVV